jgi:WD40 repeat protein
LRDGTLVVEVDDPRVKVDVDGKTISIPRSGVKEIRLHPGSHEVKATRDGVPVLRELVTIDRGGQRVLQIGLNGSRPYPRVAMRAQGSECSSVAFSPDGSMLAAAYGNGCVILWSPANGRGVMVLGGPRQFVSSVAFSPDGKTLAVGTGYWTRREVDGVVDLWDLTSWKRRARFEGHKGPVYCVAFAPDGHSVASVGIDGTPRIWNVESVQPRAPLPKQEDWIFSIAYAPDGKTVAIGNQMAVRLIDPATGRERGLLEGHRGQIEAVAFSPDGRTIASGGRDQLIKLWDTATLQERATLVGHAGWVSSLAFSPDGSMLAAASLEGDHSKEIRLWDAASGQALATLSGVNSHSVAFSPDGRSIATGDVSGAAKIWDVADLLKWGANR